MPNDVLLTKAGHILGYSAVFPKIFLKGNITSHLAAIRPSNEVFSEFLATYLRSNLSNRQIYRWGNKATRPELNTEEVREILIILPPLEIQKQLVAELEKARQTRKEKLAKADELLGSFDDYLLEQLGLDKPQDNYKKVFAVSLKQIKNSRFDPKYKLIQKQNMGKFQLVNLGSLVEIEPEYGSGSRAIPLTSSEDIKYIRITDFGDYGIPKEHEFMTAEIIDQKYNLQHEDVLFARSGATVGKTYIYTQDIGSAIFAGYCIRFRFNQNLVLPWYVYFYTKTSLYKSWINSIQRPSGQPNINKQEFKSFKISLPPLDYQEMLVQEMRNRLEQTQKLKQEAEEEWEKAKQRFEHQLLGEEYDIIV